MCERALERIARAPGSKFVVSKKMKPASGGDSEINDLREVVAWTCSVRTVLRGPGVAYISDRTPGEGCIQRTFLGVAHPSVGDQ